MNMKQDNDGLRPAYKPNHELIYAAYRLSLLITYLTLVTGR